MDIGPVNLGLALVFARVLCCHRSCLRCILTTLAICANQRVGYTLLYADDIILLAPSVMSLEKLLHNCELELNWIDMVINSKKSFFVCVLANVTTYSVDKLSVLLVK